MIVKAIKNLVPNAKFSISGNFTYEDIVWQDERPIPNKEEVELETQKVQADYDSKQYQRDRASQYPSIQDQLDMQYWDSVNGTTTWKDSIAKVKADNPKPE